MTKQHKRNFNPKVSEFDYPNNIFESMVSSYMGYMTHLDRKDDILKLSEEDFTEDQMKGLNHVLSFFDDEIQLVFKLRYQEKKSLDEIGQVIGVTKERVRQRIALGLRMMRNPARLKFIINGYDACVEVAKKLVNPNTENAIPIEELELPNRALFPLKRAGIKTVDQLIEIMANKKECIRKIRTFGEKSYEITYDKLLEKGFIKK